MELELKRLFQEHFREPAATFSPLKGDGSYRKLFRLTAGNKSAIGVVNADRKENAAFLGFSRHFKQARLPVPEIFAEDSRQGIYLEEDLGDVTLFQYLTENRTGERLSDAALAAYDRVVRALPQFQITAGKTLDYGLCYPRGAFDKQSMMWDLNYFKYNFLKLGQVPFDEQKLEDDFERFTAFLLSAERDFFLYRDFQSRNIMIVRGFPHFIDYQGGRKGALQYDIASLLYDAKADLPFKVRDELLERYIEAASGLARIDRKEFLRLYYGYVYIRIMQAMGTYGLRGFHEKKHHFLQSIPYAIRNLEHVLRVADLPLELPELTRVFKRLTSSSRLRQFGGASLKLTVRVESFSFKDGVPVDEKGHGGGFVFDCRALPNPGREERYAQSTGKDADVAAYLEKHPEVRRFLDNVWGLVAPAVENYRSRNFTDLLVSFGCTGGQHRSVYCAESLSKRLRDAYGVEVQVRHRRQEKNELDAVL